MQNVLKTDFKEWFGSCRTIAHTQKLGIIGQWVYAGERDNIGRFYGHGRRSGVTVVAWRGNWKGRYREYTKAISRYADTLRDPK